jgi:molecular chaperone DnaK
VPVIIENSEGEGTTPCYVAITSDGRRLVGEAARRYALRDPANVAYAVKRFIGRQFKEREVQTIRQYMPYEIEPNAEGDAWVRLQGQLYSPVQISAFILQKMKQTAEAYLGEPVTEALVTVPAYFNDSQRQATKDAGNIAGFTDVRIFAEPTMAALAYGDGNSATIETIAVYDLGGGTFDISILEVGDGVFDVRSTSGDVMLGGEDLDYELVKVIANEFQSQHRIDLTKDSIARLRLKQAAENLKIDLSSEPSAAVDLPFLAAKDGTPLHLHRVVQRPEYERLIDAIAERTIGICKQACKDAGLAPGNISKTILVGGSTRIPLVRRKIEEFFGKAPYGALRREDAVALGAAIRAGIGLGDIKNVVLLDVTPLSLGIETLGGVFTRLIDRNTTIPTKKGQVFSTAEDNQQAVTIRVFQGEREMAADNRPLGQFDLVGIPPAPRGVPQIEVTFDIDANGIVSVGAKDKTTNKEQSMRIQPSGGLSTQDISKMRIDAGAALIDRARQSAVVKISGTPTARNRLDHDETTTPALVRPLGDNGDIPRIFVSYAHEDAQWAAEVVKALSLLKRTGRAEIWIDRMIGTGDAWKEEIFGAIARSNVALLLLSNDFFASDFILENELPMVFAERERRRLALIPVLVRPCPFELHDEVSKFQLFNSPERPFASLEKWEVESELLKLAKEIAEGQKFS